METVKLQSAGEQKHHMRTVGSYVLEQIQHNIDEDAVIAGGWARDLTISDAPVPKDVDVWFYTGKSLANVHARIEQLFPGSERNASLVAEPGSLAYSYARAIFKYTVQGVDVDFILLPKPVDRWEILNRFDFGVCQIGFDGMQFYHTNKFATDVYYKRLELTDAAYERPDLGRIVHDRLPRMRKKFRNWDEGNMPNVAPLPPSAGKVGFSAVYFDE